MELPKRNRFVPLSVTVLLFLAFFFQSIPGVGCSMILAGRKATADGSVLLAHNNDLPAHIASQISIIPAQSHPDGAVVTFKNGLEIPRSRETYKMLIMHCYYGFSEGDAVAVNQFQVAIAGGVALKGDRNERAEKLDPLVKNGVSGYIRYIALQRAKTARECVQIIGDIYSRYGISYPSGVGVADTDEIWYLEVGGGKCWVAQRVPDDSYLAVANGYRIGAVDFNDKKNFIYPPYLKSYCIEKGLWKPGNKKGNKQGNKQNVFNFAKIFGGKKETENDYYNARRVWRMQQLLSPSSKPNPQSFTHPLLLKPDQPVSLPALFAILRDCYQDTPFHCPIPYPGSPNHDERVIGISRTVHTDVIQLRKNLPPEIGAVMWAGTGASNAVPYIPYYLGIEEVPEPYTVAGPTFDNDSAYWQFRTLTTLTAGKPLLTEEIVFPQWRQLETQLLEQQKHIEKTAYALYAKNKQKARRFLTRYCGGLAIQALYTAQKLEEKLKTRLAETAD